VSAEPVPPAPSLTVHEILTRWGPPYLADFGATMPPRQRAVLRTILQCRTAALGGQLFLCPECGHAHYQYHSCNDRHCPQCGGTDADAWLETHQALLLPVPYFLVTFTVPEALRRWMRSHPAQAYDALFAASAGALQALALNPKRLGAQLGMLGLLHTWSRTLEYHPHLHYLVPGGGLSPDGRTWVASGPKFLLRVEPLSDHYRSRFHHYLARHHPQALAQIPPPVWRQRWVTHCQPVGNGAHALRYLSRYVFKTATGNRTVHVLPDGRLGWPYRDRTTGQRRTLPLQPRELIRRFLQHVLPAGFHRVRRFGWLHPAGRKNLNRVRALLDQQPLLTPAEQTAWLPEDLLEPGLGSAPAPPPAPISLPRLCPDCQTPLRRVGSWPRGGLAPPRPSVPVRKPP
jgi:hypothetical protein